MPVFSRISSQKIGLWFQTLNSSHISIYYKNSFKMYKNQNGPLSWADPEYEALCYGHQGNIM